jgi:hypothetical protein
MNTERLAYLATWLEEGAKHELITFDMEYGISIQSEDYDASRHNACKTSCCIAGAATQFFMPKDNLVELFRKHAPQTIQPEWMDNDDKSVDWYPVFESGKDLLGLTEEQASALFAPGGRGTRMSEYLEDYNDPAWAGRTIRHLIKTGEVDWEATKQST